jgi:hypothetical protein
MLTKGTINQKKVIIVNIYAPDICALIFIKQTLDLKAQTNPKTMILRDFHISLSLIDIAHPDKKQQRNLRIK